MHPELIPGLPVQTFGFCVAVGMYLGWALLEKLSGRKDIGSFAFCVLAAGIAGARIAHVVEYWHADGFDENFFAAFKIWNGGLVFYGGLAAALAAALVWCMVKHADILSIADIAAIALPIGHAFGRIGCFCYGCCWGKVSSSSIALTFPSHSPVWCSHLNAGLIRPTSPSSLPVLPTQLIESVLLFALAALLLFIYRKCRAWTAAAYCLLYAAIRFLIEYLRDDDRPEWSGLSSAQLFSLLLFAIGIALLAWSIKRHGKHTSNPK